MALTAKADWQRERIDFSSLRQTVLADLSGQGCWNVTKCLGSMLVLDFGRRIKIPLARGGLIEAGEMTISVADCYWQFLRNEHMVVDSDHLSEDTFRTLLQLLARQKISSLNKTGQGIRIAFSNDLEIFVDCSNKYDAQDAILTFTLHQGRIYEIAPLGDSFLSDRVSLPRLNLLP
jgi:hypothetical protein